MTDHKEQLKSYFDGEGFTRWQKIYGEEPIAGVRKSVREGHARVVELASEWLNDPHRSERRATNGDQSTSAADMTGDRRPLSILDAGCGTGLMSVALARQGWSVTAIDIAPQMVTATAARASAAGVGSHVHTMSGDLDAIDIVFDAVVCLDVLIHYPAQLFAPMLARLAGRTRGPLVFTYAPHEPLLSALHWIGGRFPKPQRRTEIQMIPETLVQAALHEAGMRIQRSERVSVGFYHVALVEAIAF